MELWYSKALGNSVSAFAPSRRIQDLFLPMFSAAGQPLEMAVFSRHDPRANQVTAYFSPGASKLAALFGAQACEKPSSDGIGLLVGDARCWEIFFPGRKRRAA